MRNERVQFTAAQGSTHNCKAAQSNPVGRHACAHLATAVHATLCRSAMLALGSPKKGWLDSSSRSCFLQRGEAVAGTMAQPVRHLQACERAGIEVLASRYTLQQPQAESLPQSAHRNWRRSILPARVRKIMEPRFAAASCSPSEPPASSSDSSPEPSALPLRLHGGYEGCVWGGI